MFVFDSLKRSVSLPLGFPDVKFVSLDTSYGGSIMIKSIELRSSFGK